MQYIRTKDGHIFPYQGTDKEFFYYEYGEFKSSPIIKRTNTIEELCDRYIVKNIVSRKYTIYTPKQYDRFKDRHILTYLDIKNGCKEVYGAIWTDKGLKYVAKMNEKGEMELL